jgi:SAM-dependent methyltransferase
VETYGVLVSPPPRFSIVTDDGYFDEEVADRYDDPDWEMFSADAIDPVVDFLASQARGGAALEFGIGTGRIALPLSARGVRVSGIDLSTAMVRRLADKPGGGDIDVTIGDFATTRAGGSFDLVFLVFNTIMNLTTQADQVACFRNAATHLTPGGCFVIEVMVPDLRRLPPGQTGVVFRADETGFGIDLYDVANQGLISNHIAFAEGGDRRSSVPFRYVWPAELDLMAEMAGLRLHERHGGWKGEPFDSESRSHVSVWMKN